MVKHISKIRVRYADTDQMQFVYNGKYLEYFEVGRTELLREVGLAYSQLEKEGYQLPLIEAGLKYKGAAFYDDMLEVEAALSELHSSKVRIDYKIRRENSDEVITEGFTEHIFIKKETKKAVRPPRVYVEALEPFFKY
jgi:acyl-CoA thioester hydrolase